MIPLTFKNYYNEQILDNITQNLKIKSPSLPLQF